MSEQRVLCFVLPVAWDGRHHTQSNDATWTQQHMRPMPSTYCSKRIQEIRGRFCGMRVLLLNYFRQSGSFVEDSQLHPVTCATGAQARFVVLLPHPPSQGWLHRDTWCCCRRLRCRVVSASPRSCRRCRCFRRLPLGLAHEDMRLSKDMEVGRQVRRRAHQHLASPPAGESRRRSARPQPSGGTGSAPGSPGQSEDECSSANSPRQTPQAGGSVGNYSSLGETAGLGLQSAP